MQVHAADTTSFVSRFFSVAGIVGRDDAPGCLIAPSSLDTAELLTSSGWATVANSKQCMQWGGACQRRKTVKIGLSRKRRA
jgi:hypothetical protein